MDRKERSGAILSRRSVLGVGATAAAAGLWPQLWSQPASAAPGAPAVVHATWNATPGDVMGLYGGRFVSGLPEETSVRVLPLTGFTGELSPEAASIELGLVNAQPNVVQGVLPATAPEDVYAMWVGTADGWSAPMFVNRAEVFWCSERTVFAGQVIRLFGRNLLRPDGLVRAKVRFIDLSDESLIEVQAVGASAYTVDVEVPANVLSGHQYTVAVTNGAGGQYGWARMSDTEAFSVIDANQNLLTLRDEVGVDAAFLANIPHDQRFNVEDFGAVGDGHTDATAGIQAALDAAAAAGGGVVFVPAGTYSVSRLDMSSRTVLLGEGRDLTSLIYDGTLVPEDDPPDPTKGGSIRFIKSTGAEIVIAKLSVVNEVERPAGDTKYRISGWVNMVMLKQPGSVQGRGYILKNIRVKTADGRAIYIPAQSDVVIEDNDIESSHTALYYSTVDGYSRVRNNVLTNEQRGLIVEYPSASRSWIEGNVLNGRGYYLPNPDQDRYPDMQGGHRYASLNSTFHYIAGNRTEGNFGSRANDGEGLLFEAGNFNAAYGPVGQAHELSITLPPGAVLVPGDLVGLKIVITGGTGVGQLRTVTSNTDKNIYIDEPWTIIPDATSYFAVTRRVNHRNILVGNVFNAKTNKSDIQLHSKDVDNIIDGNECHNGSGIWLVVLEKLAQDRLNVSYFPYVRNNTLDGAGPVPQYFNANSVVIGQMFGGGTFTADESKSVLYYGSEFRGNYMVGIGTNAEDLEECIPVPWDPSNCKSNGEYVRASGINLGFGEEPSRESIPMSQGVIVQGNTVTNTIAGIHLKNVTYDTVLYGNDFSGNGAAIDDVGSVRTIIL